MINKCTTCGHIPCLCYKSLEPIEVNKILINPPKKEEIKGLDVFLHMLEIKKLVKETPNDQELGEKIRKLIGNDI